MSFKLAMTAAAAAAALGFAGAAQATVFLDAGNQPGLDQVHGAGGSQSGHTILGDVNGVSTTWTSTDNLETTGSGHAFIDGQGNGVFGDLAFYLTSDPNGFTALNFNLQKPSRASDFTATIKVYDLANNLLATFTPTVGNGQNKYYLHGDAGEVFSRVTFDAGNADFSSVRQFDILLAEAGGVPEPATWAMMIAGLGIAGAALRRKASLAA